MNDTIRRVSDIPALSHDDAMRLVEVENQRVVELLESLEPGDWTRATDCPLWDVRAMAGHLVGMLEAFTSRRELLRQMGKAGRATGDGVFIDVLTSHQVTNRADLTIDELLARARAAGVANARFRTKAHPILRRMPMKEKVEGKEEKWTMGYLIDTILTRDAWMHRVDISRATGKSMVLTADHDGRLVADVVAEWARRHGQPFTLRLGGPAGGSYAQGEGGDEITIDALEFCRSLSKRVEGSGLLAREVPF
jgi:uncharacterized protein (TIGR03083 family)